MDYKVQALSDLQKTDCLVMPCFADAQKPGAGIPAATRKQLSELIKQGDFKGKAGETCWLHHPE